MEAKLSRKQRYRRPSTDGSEALLQSTTFQGSPGDYPSRRVHLTQNRRLTENHNHPLTPLNPLPGPRPAASVLEK